MGFTVDLGGITLFEDAFRKARDEGHAMGRARMIVLALVERFGAEAVPDGLASAFLHLSTDEAIRTIMGVGAATSVEAVVASVRPRRDDDAGA